jgi:hypothetical protein
MRNMRQIHWVVPALAALLIGCATGAAERGTRAQPNLITADEIAATNLSNALDIVQSLRPNWLRERGPVSIRNRQGSEVVIYVDGTRFGGMETLRQVRASSVASMQYLNSSEATFRFGTNHVGGAIVIHTPAS